MDKNIARIVDANFNRCRESLRVMEDYARFVLNNGQLSGAIKQARHELREIIEGLGGVKLLAGRNTPSDVGTEISTSGEMNRTDTTAVATAACKRVVESLRVMEEFSKTVQAQTAKQLEEIRYKCYEWEVQLLSRGQNKSKLGQMRLYVLISSELCKKDPLEVAKDVLRGGADVVQLREKKMGAGKYMTLAAKMAELCRQKDKLFVVNDRPDVAVAAGADGVHLGQEDLKIAQARKVLSSEMIIGVSTHNIEQAKQAVADGADYIGVGPVFATGTKPSAEPVGVEYVRQAASEVDVPQAVIGGISLDNVAEVIEAGAKCVAVCSAIICADEPGNITRNIKNQIAKIKITNQNSK